MSLKFNKISASCHQFKVCYFIIMNFFKNSKISGFWKFCLPDPRLVLGRWRLCRQILIHDIPVSLLLWKISLFRVRLKGCDAQCPIASKKKEQVCIKPRNDFEPADYMQQKKQVWIDSRNDIELQTACLTETGLMKKCCTHKNVPYRVTVRRYGTFPK